MGATMNLLAEGLSDWAAIGTFATVVIGGIVAGVVSLLKASRDGKKESDDRADSTWKAAVTRQDVIISEQKADIRLLQTQLGDCQKDHAKTDVRLQYIEKEAKDCRESRDALATRLSALENAKPQN
jgi:gas vesicle protein